MPTEEKTGLQAIEVVEPLYRVKGWIKFFCISQIIAAVLHIIGGLFLFFNMHPIGFFYLFSGGGILFTVSKLYPSIRLIEAAYEKESKDDVLDFTYTLAFYLKAVGILIISSIVVLIGVAGLSILLRL